MKKLDERMHNEAFHNLLKGLARYAQMSDQPQWRIDWLYQWVDEREGKTDAN